MVGRLQSGLGGGTGVVAEIWWSQSLQMASLSLSLGSRVMGMRWWGELMAGQICGRGKIEEGEWASTC